jgi:hypothetical protein
MICQKSDKTLDCHHFEPYVGPSPPKAWANIAREDLSKKLKAT